MKRWKLGWGEVWEENLSNTYVQTNSRMCAKRCCGKGEERHSVSWILRQARSPVLPGKLTTCGCLRLASDSTGPIIFAQKYARIRSLRLPSQWEVWKEVCSQSKMHFYLDILYSSHLTSLVSRPTCSLSQKSGITMGVKGPPTSAKKCLHWAS